MLNSTTRRSFLCSAPLAAAGLSLSEVARAQTSAATPVLFQLFSASQLTKDAAALQIKPGNNNLFANPTLPFTVVLTTEKKHSATEFEWHEGRDHIVQILEGTTTYELGGRPEGAHNNKLPTEWLAPTSAGATTLHLHKGDMLVIPRGTPHKRSTEASVTFYLISTTGK